MNASKQTLCDKAYAILEDLIVSRKLEPGSKVTEEQLSKRIGIGRTPIREALQLLARDGVVEIRPRSASVILDMTIERKRQLLEARGAIQEQTVRYACRRADVDQRTKMLLLARAVEDAGAIGDIELYLRISRDIHNILCEAARNEFLSRFMHSLYTLSRQFAYTHLMAGEGDMQRFAASHSGILRAVAALDEEAAVAASETMMRFMQEFVDQMQDDDGVAAVDQLGRAGRTG
ncbi:GntR family transcriptional regulator [Oceanibacterium hippocampi]|uniref:Putative HTH-type transcriptional regulator YjjM n=1 Tax=Oceanibacterium hippocampi TaxID=745714 RepID=A0A1Y5TNM9_9PROT|nr:GntR family transcriptional regulator [Oceanibacterium hippocampi]SLN64628.1 putative HTH-type transcriptional regulator YjjM [Oceanibacterium hippocampi]